MNKYTSFTPSGEVSPYTVPEAQRGWRRMTVPGDYKRKVFTMYWNDQFLVQANLSWGEKGVRHNHESGELTITFSDALHPFLHYNPPGQWHGGETGPREEGSITSTLALLESATGTDPSLIAFLKQLLEQQEELSRRATRLARIPGPHVALDILFPPFKTTIDDPAYPGSPKAIVGPWED